jgi:hypothetical protein
VLPAPVVEELLADLAPVATDDDDPLSRWSALLDATLPPPVVEETPHSTVELVRSDLPPRPVENLDPETAQRRARLRARAAEELVAAQEEVEALREAEVARVALAEELSIIESLMVIESTDESQSSDPVDVVATDDVVESVAEPTEEPESTADASDDLGLVDTTETADATEAPETVVVPDTAVATDVLDAVAATEPPVEAVEVEDSPVEQAAELPSDPLVDRIDELVAEELLDADLPLAAVAAEAQLAELPVLSELSESSELSELPAPSELSEAAEQSAVVPNDEPVAESADDTDALDTLDTLDAPASLESLESVEPVEPAEEHDPALAAALMRELSSLGLDDEPAPALTTTRSPRVPAPRHAAPPSRKKRGIFGR